MKFEARPKRWGSSLGIVLPKRIVEKQNIKEKDKIIIEVRNRPLAGEFFGMFPRKSKKTAQEIKDEMRAGW